MAELGRHYFLAFWRFPPVSVILVAAAIFHLISAFRALITRGSFRMPVWEAAQMVLGFAIPPLLAQHIAGTMLAHQLYGFEDTYAVVMHALQSDRVNFSRQIGVTLIAWLHGMIGIHYWLRLKPGYQRVTPYVVLLATLIPLFSMLGITRMAQEVAILAQVPGWVASITQGKGGPGIAHRYDWVSLFLWAYAASIAAVFLYRAIRYVLAYRRLVPIRYANGRLLRVMPGMTLLEASRAGGVPHAAICGGRGRCSTCRVRVLNGQANLTPMTEREQALLARLHAPPSTRLACQARIFGPAQIDLLLPASVGPRFAIDRSHAQEFGTERKIAILFADLRGFTKFAENRLPYDVVFMLNRYFGAMGEVIEQSGGRVDKFIGDGIMALFGLDTGSGRAARDGIAAAYAMRRRLASLNEELSYALNEPLRIGIGVHFGTVIVGEMGFKNTRAFTAIGDNVNIAARLESATKEVGADILFSATLVRKAEIAHAEWRSCEISLRGRANPIIAYMPPEEIEESESEHGLPGQPGTEAGQLGR
jgi:adenylate cyclase